MQGATVRQSMGLVGKQRPIKCIDLSRLRAGKSEVTAELMGAAKVIGFFQVLSGERTFLFELSG